MRCEPGRGPRAQALECVKLLTGLGEPLRGRMLVFDSLSARPFMSVLTRPRCADCPACGNERRAAFSLEARRRRRRRRRRPPKPSSLTLTLTFEP